MSHVKPKSPSDLRLLPTPADRPVRSGQVTDMRWREWSAFTCYRYLILSREGCTLVVPWEHLPLTQDALDLACSDTPATSLARAV